MKVAKKCFIFGQILLLFLLYARRSIVKVFIIDGDAWRGKAHYSPSLDVVFISDKVDRHARDDLIERVTKSSHRTIWR